MIPPETLEWLLRVAGAGLILLAVLHIPISRELKWKDEGKRLSPMNESVFHVHTFFVCLVLVMMALPSLLAPEALLERSEIGKWTTVSWSIFWLIRLYCQWFVYRSELWKGKRMETVIHYWFTLVWIYLATVYGAAAACQFARL
ncbi:MAG: hypothetical protein WCH40_06005 [Verrucomicrobiales bacterium]